MPPATDNENDVHQSTKPVDWQDFRDHLTTADKQGRRKWLFPRKPAGRWYQRRTFLSWLLIGIMFAGPFIKINGNPLLMINIVERRFSILGQIFWPQDSLIFAVAVMIFIVGIIVFTAAFGRLWCGWTCPQTIMMEMVFRKIEYAIEGDSTQQRLLRDAPWSAHKIAIKLTKHSIFFALSFLIGNTLLSYIIGADQLLQIITDPPTQHIAGLTFMLLFTLIFYAIFARFREQACTFICPYGRLQSTMLDENSMIVAYDHKRGEGRGRLNRGQSFPARREEGLGDCVNCRACVSVCPTGIDIRDGLQMECVNCTACIDACDTVMTKVGLPKGLIRYASLNSISKGQPFRITTRIKGYMAVLAALIGLFLFLVFTRSAVQTTLLRAPGALYQLTQSGGIENIYTVKLINKTSHDLPVTLRLENIPGKLSVMGAANVVVPKENLLQTSVLIEIAPRDLTSPTTPLKIGVYSNQKKIDTIKTVFVGPRDGSIGK